MVTVWTVSATLGTVVAGVAAIYQAYRKRREVSKRQDREQVIDEVRDIIRDLQGDVHGPESLEDEELTGYLNRLEDAALPKDDQILSKTDRVLSKLDN